MTLPYYIEQLFDSEICTCKCKRRMHADTAHEYHHGPCSKCGHERCPRFTWKENERDGRPAHRKPHP